MAEIKFANGIWVERPSEKAPDFLKAKISIKPDEFIPFLEMNKRGGGYVMLDVKESKSGKLYVSLNEYKKGTLKSPTEDQIAETIPPIDLDVEPEQEMDTIPF